MAAETPGPDRPAAILLLKWLCLCIGKLCEDMPEVRGGAHCSRELPPAVHTRGPGTYAELRVFDGVAALRTSKGAGEGGMADAECMHTCVWCALVIRGCLAAHRWRPRRCAQMR